eukprot:CAMPEP_0197640016 /NCGR_PEP_ID=MMETSP1338-20131121/14450_1 /TAXON_ID=43686 ORGANISM="Pelagodinium beii, Strain RCC1491" /NCGR_SAMPLE_ID=MMETSP1338 /ASSEMBLY_ACC=CAM_ASM_000754 /LENGTH=368 /DNA_ID=CAMNT_0043212821 /DNA_START=36 /DNA_END=1139 /DNA_ORIENTATION=-
MASDVSGVVSNMLGEYSLVSDPNTIDANYRPLAAKHRYQQPDGVWGLFWDSGMSNAYLGSETEPGWWVAEADTWNRQGLAWVAGREDKIPETGWQLRGNVGVFYYSIPIKVETQQAIPALPTGPSAEQLQLALSAAREDAAAKYKELLKAHLEAEQNARRLEELQELREQDAAALLSLTQQCRDKDKELYAVKQQNEQKVLESESLLFKVQELEAALDAVQSSASEQEKLRPFQTMIEELQLRNKDLLREIEDSDGRLEELENANATLQASLEETSRSREELFVELEKLQAEMEQLRAEMEQLKAKEGKMVRSRSPVVVTRRMIGVTAPPVISTAPPVISGYRVPQTMPALPQTSTPVPQLTSSGGTW